MVHGERGLTNRRGRGEEEEERERRKDEAEHARRRVRLLLRDVRRRERHELVQREAHDEEERVERAEEPGEEDEDEWAFLAHSVSAVEVGAGSESAEIRARAEEGGRLRKRNFFTAQVS